jgi:hypothetical protein
LKSKVRRTKKEEEEVEEEEKEGVGHQCPPSTNEH